MLNVLFQLLCIALHGWGDHSDILRFFFVATVPRLMYGNQEWNSVSDFKKTRQNMNQRPSKHSQKSAHCQLSRNQQIRSNRRRYPAESHVQLVQCHSDWQRAKLCFLVDQGGHIGYICEQSAQSTMPWDNNQSVNQFQQFMRFYFLIFKKNSSLHYGTLFNFFVGLVFCVRFNLQYFSLLTVCVVVNCLFVCSDICCLIVGEAPVESSDQPLPAATAKIEM